MVIEADDHNVGSYKIVVAGLAKHSNDDIEE